MRVRGVRERVCPILPSARSPPHKAYEPFVPPPEAAGKKQIRLPNAGPALLQVGKVQWGGGRCSGVGGGAVGWGVQWGGEVQ